LNQLVAEVRSRVESWEPQVGAAAIQNFVVEELSNWYIRRNRRRFWKSESDRDKAAAYHTLYEALTTVTRLLAPWLPFITEEMYQNLVRAIDPRAKESVHLTDYPVADETQIDASLSYDMAAVLEVVRLGRSARTEAGIKVRQPLAGIRVYAREPRFLDAVLKLQDQVLEELNVKTVSPLVELGEFVQYDIKPNLAALGPKYGKLLGEIRQKLASLSPASVAETVKNGETVAIGLNDGSVAQLEPSEILVDLKRAPGYAAAQGQNSTVVLDTDLTPELIAEGYVRDFIRGVQDARKDANFQIDDRIVLSYEAPAELETALAGGAETIQAETLASEFASGAASNGSYQGSVKVGDFTVQVSLARASS
jgi:isoleucyl-tRNA synthetase